MNDSSYLIRNYQPADFDKYIQLDIEAEKLEPSRRYIAPQAPGESLGRPNYSPQQDLFIVEIGENLVGYIDVLPELTIGRVVLDCWVHPKHRRQGIATKLLDSAIHRAEELGARVAQVNIIEGNTAAKSVLSGLGFRFVRRFLHMSLDLAKVRWQDMEQAALQCHHLQRGEEDKLTQIQNRTFAGIWGYNPNTVETISYWTNLSNSSPEDVILAYDGDKVTGYCWTGTNYAGEAGSDKRKGRIFMLGADPDYRGKGVGKRVLLAGLAHLRSKGLQVAELTVDSENKVACALYRSLGFEVETSSVWYEKAIN